MKRCLKRGKSRTKRCNSSPKADLRRARAIVSMESCSSAETFWKNASAMERPPPLNFSIKGRCVLESTAFSSTLCNTITCVQYDDSDRIMLSIRNQPSRVIVGLSVAFLGCTRTLLFGSKPSAIAVCAADMRRAISPETRSSSTPNVSNACSAADALALSFMTSESRSTLSARGRALSSARRMAGSSVLIASTRSSRFPLVASSASSSTTCSAAAISSFSSVLAVTAASAVTALLPAPPERKPESRRRRVQKRKRCTFRKMSAH
mmetsp:Transcript_13550/g.36397  ORF Transcript_13550/g.36397 Transcript_13550/m.36397 type:complete len:264 (-) Transcript_13550:64-855(-)